MIGTYEEAVYERLLNVDWKLHDADKSASQHALFTEYTRRVAVWCQALGCEHTHPIYADIPKRIAPEVSSKPIYTTELQAMMRTVGRTSVYERMIVTRMLNFAAAVDAKGDNMPHGLTDLYEPLLMFFERGGWIEKGARDEVWRISGHEVTLHRVDSFADRTPLDLNYNLDALDSLPA
ncbi:MAG: hypothetical protein AAF125_09405 [Chloroflexota bacterium]